MSNLAYLNCGITEMDRPLITLKFRQKELYICPQCLPTLIHKPFQLADKIPGATLSENSSEHDE